MPSVGDDLASVPFVPGRCREVFRQVVHTLLHLDAWGHEFSSVVLPQVLRPIVPWSELLPSQLPPMEGGRVEFALHGSGDWAPLWSWSWCSQCWECFPFGQACGWLSSMREDVLDPVRWELKGQVVQPVQLRPLDLPADGSVREL